MCDEIEPMDSSNWLEKSFSMSISIMKDYQEMYFHFNHLIPALKQLQSEMIGQYKFSAWERLDLADIKVGGYYAARTNFDWSRVQVTKIIVGDAIQVFCVDFGCPCIVESASCFRKLTPDLMKPPKMTFKARFLSIPPGLQGHKRYMSKLLFKNSSTVVTFKEFDNEGTASVIILINARDVFDIMKEEIKKEQEVCTVQTPSMPAQKTPQKSDTPSCNIPDIPKCNVPESSTNNAPDTHAYDIPDLVESPGLTFSFPTNSPPSIFEDEPSKTPDSPLSQSPATSYIPMQYQAPVLPPPAISSNTGGFIATPPHSVMSPPPLQQRNLTNTMVSTRFYNPYAVQFNMMNQLKMHAQQCLFLWNMLSSDMNQFSGAPLFMTCPQSAYPTAPSPQPRFYAPHQQVFNPTPSFPQQYPAVVPAQPCYHPHPPEANLHQRANETVLSPAPSQVASSQSSHAEPGVSPQPKLHATVQPPQPLVTNARAKGYTKVLPSELSTNPQKCFHPGVVSCQLCAKQAVSYQPSASLTEISSETSLQRDFPREDSPNMSPSKEYDFHSVVSTPPCTSPNVFFPDVKSAKPNPLPTLHKKTIKINPIQEKPSLFQEARHSTESSCYINTRRTPHGTVSVPASPRGRPMKASSPKTNLPLPPLDTNALTRDTSRTKISPTFSKCKASAPRRGFPPEWAFRYPPPPASPPQPRQERYTPESLPDWSPNLSFFDESYYGCSESQESSSAYKTFEQSEDGSDDTIALSPTDRSLSGLDDELAVRDCSEITNLLPSLTLLTDGSEDDFLSVTSVNDSLPADLPPIYDDFFNGEPLPPTF